jgi:hypothetical protein
MQRVDDRRQAMKAGQRLRGASVCACAISGTHVMPLWTTTSATVQHASTKHAGAAVAVATPAHTRAATRDGHITALVARVNC